MDFLGSDLFDRLRPLRAIGLVLFSILMMLAPPSYAQPVSWIQTDIGSTGATGTYSYSAGTYTIAGAGSAIGGTSDSFSYVNVQTTGNVEMIAKVTSQTNTSAYAVAGLMIRDSLNANGATAVIGVSPQNGVNFTYRATAGAASTTTLGPSIAAPVYLRIVRSQTSVAGYQSSDGISWNLVGEAQITLPQQFYIGFAVCSNSFGNLSTAVFNNVNYFVNVPQRNANLITWLRADAGVVYSSGNVSQWTDQSGNGNNGIQGIGGDQPTLVTGALNGLPAIGFNGTSQFLHLPALTSTAFSSGVSVFVVTKPTTGTGGTRFIDLGTTTPSNNSIALAANSTTTNTFFTVNGSGTGSQLFGTMTLNQYQLMEGIQNGSAGTGAVYTNGVLAAGSPGTLVAPSSIARNVNYIGQYDGGGYYLQGQIAEILVYNTGVTSAQRASIESYIYSKYGLGNEPTLDAPVITPSSPSSVFSTPTISVTLSQDQGAQIWYTTNGSTPVPGTSTLYTGTAFTISGSTTVKAIASAPFFNNSAVSSVFLQYDPTTANVPQNSNLLAWYKADNGVTTSGSNVTQWSDMSSYGNTATQSNSSNQPTLVSNAVNSLPAISFNGTSDFLQLPAGASSTFNNFTSGSSIFIVTKPAAVGMSGDRFIDFGPGSTTNSIGFAANSSTQALFFCYGGGAFNTLGTPLTLSQYQLIEAVQTNAGSNNAIAYTNGVGGLATTIPVGTLTSRNLNYIGQYSGGGFFLQGQIAEILVYNAPLTTTQRQGVENYLMTRYAIGVQAPVITTNPSTGIPLYTTPVTVSISASPNARIFYTTDGSTPTTSSSLYSTSFVVTEPTTVKAIAVETFATSSVATLQLNVDISAAPVMTVQPLTWLRSDLGVSISSGTSVNGWSDMSGSNNFGGSSGVNQPTLVQNAINGYPAINFNGGNSYMTLPPTSVSWSNGVSIFIVANCNSVNQAGDRFIEFSNSTGAGYDAIALYANSSTSDGYLTSNGYTTSGVAGSMATNQYQLLEAVQQGTSGSGSATTYTNGIAGNTATLAVPPSPIYRANNYIGQYSGGGYFLQGQIAEIIVYSTALTTGQRAGIESYLLNRYQLSLLTPPAPTISVAAGTLPGPTQVAIAGQAGQSIYFTTDGSTPTTSSNLYLGPINVYYSQTVKAIAVRNGVSSSVTSAAYTLNSTQWPAPGTDATPLQIQLQLPTIAVPQ